MSNLSHGFREHNNIRLSFCKTTSLIVVRLSCTTYIYRLSLIENALNIIAQNLLWKGQNKGSLAENWLGLIPRYLGKIFSPRVRATNCSNFPICVCTKYVVPYFAFFISIFWALTYCIVFSTSAKGCVEWLFYWWEHIPSPLCSGRKYESSRSHSHEHHHLWIIKSAQCTLFLLRRRLLFVIQRW